MGRGVSKAAGGGGFKVFTSNHKNGLEYENDNGETAKWFSANSNADSIIGNVTPDQEKAIRDYASGLFMYGQLYDGFDSLTSKEKKTARELDSVLDNATLKEGIVVTRLATGEMVLGKGKGYGSYTEADYNAHKGEFVSCPAYLSTGAANEGLSIGKKVDGAVEYKIKIPKGAKGAGMWIGDKRVNGWGDQQREFLMNRDAQYKIGPTKYDKARKVFVTELEWIGREPHDYGKGGK